VQFLFQPLTWGFLLVLLPLLIHLINLVRHRRTEWAAIEFLLESYRRHRRWVWLKQALLIASRMLAVAIAVAMLAQWVGSSRWLSMLSQSTTHHYFVLDDSVSMGDSASGGNAYQSALGAIQTIARSAGVRDGNHLISVLRASKAIGASQEPRGKESSTDESKGTSSTAITADSIADFFARSIPSDPSSLLNKLMSTQPSAHDCSLDDAVAVLGPVMQQNPNEKAILYLLSDFRQKDWQSSTGLVQQLQGLPKNDLEIQLVDCAPVRHENLTLVSLTPQQEVLVAGVPALLNVVVRNNGAAPMRNVTVRITAIDYSDTELLPKSTLPYSGLTTELPPVLIDRIEAGESVTRQTQILFPRGGSHVVEAQLPPDPLLADNKSHCVLDLQEGIKVLLIDGDATGKHSFFVESALDPGSSVKTGLLLNRQSPEFLRDSDAAVLNQFACIVMQAVPRLDARAVEHLHAYVSQGGGLAVWFGELMTEQDYASYNDLFRQVPVGAVDRRPLLPVPIKGVANLERSREETTPDFVADSHPVFNWSQGLNNSPFLFVRIQRYIELDESGLTEPGAKTYQPVLTLRNKRPLMIDHAVGQGRVLYGLTVLDRQWTNWPQDPTFAITAQKIVGYLSSYRNRETSQLVGAPMQWSFSSTEMLPELQIVCPALPGSALRPTVTLNAKPVGDTEYSSVVTTQQTRGIDEATRSFGNAGVFEWWGTSTQGQTTVKNIARNVSPLEGDLEKTTSIDINRILSGIPFTYKTVDSVGANSSLASFANRNMLLMVLLLGLLIFEQWLAWSASYHLPQKS
jgi:hypothetical protein